MYISDSKDTGNAVMADLGQEHGSNHACTVVHIAYRTSINWSIRGLKDIRTLSLALPHGSIHYGITGFTVLPALEYFAIDVFLPEHVRKLLLKRPTHTDARISRQNVLREAQAISAERSWR